MNGFWNCDIANPPGKWDAHHHIHPPGRVVNFPMTFNKEGNKGNKALVNPCFWNMSKNMHVMPSGIIQSHDMKLTWRNISTSIFVFSPALPNPTTGGKVETEPLQPNSIGHPKSSKLMDLCQLAGPDTVQTQDEISESQIVDFPPTQWKKVWSAAAWCSASLHGRHTW
jgi:hypothetical protein